MKLDNVTPLTETESAAFTQTNFGGGALQTNPAGVLRVEIAGKPGISNGMLFPGTLSVDYVIATQAQAKFTAGTRSYLATSTQAIMSPTGGAVAVTWADGSNTTFTMSANFVYPIAVTKILFTGTAVTDLQLFV